MKRSEMIDFIESELEYLVVIYSKASDKAKPHKIRSSADGILSLIEGLGMKPPENTAVLGNDFSMIRDTFFWEPEDEAKPV